VTTIRRALGAKTLGGGLGVGVGTAIWYNAGGAPDPIAAYKPKGAASLAASYVNLVNAGTYDAAPGVAPTLGAGGWTFNGTTQYLTTGITPNTANWSALVQLANGASGATVNTPFGSFDGNGFLIIQNPADDVTHYYNSALLFVVPRITSGNLGFAAQTAYRNGVAESGGMAFTANPAVALYIGALNVSGGAGKFFSGDIAEFAIWNTTLTAPQVLAVATAMSAL